MVLSAKDDFSNLVSESEGEGQLFKKFVQYLTYILGAVSACLLVYFIRTMRSIQTQKQGLGIGGSRGKSGASKSGFGSKRKR